ncbi:hypothetical protein L6164_000825 [Bauhinia variegata]|uniref:Uncharacterized protein n=1 Tax=Bauhinia variegata TaxID=167791 RepID=A0ACB9Q7X8_BAUVA|nr:hypothetical protein L6164_000825 [Bauhinia variegata]
MDYLAILLLVSFSCALIHIFISSSNKRRCHPPGPRPLPIIGNILVLGSNPHRSLAKLSKTFGPIMTLKLGSRTTIVISSPDMAEEVLKKKDQAFSSRTAPDVTRVLNHRQFSMVWLPASAKWRSLRRACATKIFSPQQLDTTQILREKKVQELLDFAGEICKNGEALDIGEAVFATTLNSLSNTLCSVDLVSLNSDLSQEFKDVVWRIMEETGKPNVVDFFPILRPFDPQRAYAKSKIYFGKFLKYFDGIIEERIRSRTSEVESKEYNDVLDSFLNVSEEDSSHLSHLDLLHLFVDLFAAGTETTSITIEWLITLHDNSLHYIVSQPFGFGGIALSSNLGNLVDCFLIWA